MKHIRLSDTTVCNATSISTSAVRLGAPLDQSHTVLGKILEWVDHCVHLQGVLWQADREPANLDVALSGESQNAARWSRDRAETQPRQLIEPMSEASTRPPYGQLRTDLNIPRQKKSSWQHHVKQLQHTWDKTQTSVAIASQPCANKNCVASIYTRSMWPKANQIYFCSRFAIDATQE